MLTVTSKSGHVSLKSLSCAAVQEHTHTVPCRLFTCARCASHLHHRSRCAAVDDGSDGGARRRRGGCAASARLCRALRALRIAGATRVHRKPVVGRLRHCCASAVRSGPRRAPGCRPLLHPFRCRVPSRATGLRRLAVCAPCARHPALSAANSSARAAPGVECCFVLRFALVCAPAHVLVATLYDPFFVIDPLPPHIYSALLVRTSCLASVQCTATWRRAGNRQASLWVQMRCMRTCCGCKFARVCCTRAVPSAECGGFLEDS